MQPRDEIGPTGDSPASSQGRDTHGLDLSGLEVRCVELKLDRDSSAVGEVELASGDLGNVEFGFVFKLSCEAADNWAALFADAPVDEDVDRRIAEWKCPGCGKGMDELTEGHAWSYDTKTKQYRCDDPPWPGGPTQFTMDCGLPELAAPEPDLVVPWDHR